MHRPLLVPLLAAFLLVGCVSVYKTDTQQGNLVTQEMVDKLRPGMTRSQVRFVLGTPLIADTFHPERWDYYFLLKKGGAGTAETRLLTVIFRNDALQRVEGDAAIRAPEIVPTANGNAAPAPANIPAPAAPNSAPRALITR